MNGTQASSTLSGNAPVLIDALNYSPLTAVLVAVTFLLLVYTSTKVVNRALDAAGVEPPSDGDDDSSKPNTETTENPNGKSTSESADSTPAETDGGTTETGDTETDSESSDEDTGTVIGKAENVLVLSLMLFEAYTALGVIFAAKSIVRKSDMDQQDTSYYLTGTLVNFTYSVVVGLLLHVTLWGIVKSDLLT